MKKYPVTYQGKEYEVRWDYSSQIFNYIELYSVTHKITFFKRDKLIYEKIYSEVINYHEYSAVDEILKLRGINKNDEDYYIQQVKVLFEMWEADLKEKEKRGHIKNAKLTTLAMWDGKIESVKVRE